MVSAINRMVLASYGLELAVVAAVTGHAIAGGFVLALCSDHRIASVEGRYGVTEVKVGVPYPQAAIGVVRAELPPHAARQLVLTNQLIGADECVRLGAFDEAPAPASVIDRPVALAADLAAFDRGAYARAKLELRGWALAARRAASETDPLLAAWV
jgi:enoyl-CoA hydratase